MVGLPGREVVTPPTDDRMVSQLRQMMDAPGYNSASVLMTKDGHQVYRTLFPSIASSHSCANCHNTLQGNSADTRWNKGDLMGAYVVDRYVDNLLLQISRVSLLFAIVSALLASSVALIILYARSQHILARRLALLASTDPLTGCINRREMYDRIHKQNAPVSGALLATDLDNFKTINDTYGHAAGDLVLADFAGRVRNCIREQDWVARIGGEEFVIWLPGVSPEDAASIGERIRAETEQAAIQSETTDIRYTVSIGLQVVQINHPTQFERWLNAADNLLYRAKLEGRNRVVAATAIPA
jgi:diguanylate cyclase (GGDEF)-like protein